MKTRLLVLALAAFLAAPFAFAAPTGADEAEIAALKKAVAELRPQQGTVDLKNGMARLNVPEGLQYLDKKDAQTILIKIWGNPPEAASDVIGMIIRSPRDVVSGDGWGIVITYTEDGHIDDADALKTDYNALLKQMKEGMVEANKERVKKGYTTVSLVGWAEPPHYDPATHKIYWAKELAFGDAQEHTLNYCTRILGRRGVLELNAVASMSALPAIRNEAKRVLEKVDFNAGNRYADFNKSTDKMATYGIAALVAGGVAAKMGFFKVLLGVLIAAKKLIVLGVVGLVAAVKRFFGGGKKEAE